MKTLSPFETDGYVYDHIIGTGGIGSGIFFSLEGDHTLGRNESRMATLLPYKDYCKQHIIMHYIAVLLGAGSGSGFRSYPIGKVGADEIGSSLISQMKIAGMDTRYVTITEGFRTLFSVCFQYPDLSGGNITTDNGASSQVSPEDINSFFSGFDPGQGKELMLSAPEVPLSARITLLEQGRKRGARNVAAIQSSEIDSFLQAGGFALTDILSINIDEAKSFAALQQESATNVVVDACIQRLISINPSITVCITDGSKGCYVYERGKLEFTPALSVKVVSTAGAGDAFLAGLICGICCGLPLFKGTQDERFAETPIATAVELGTMLAALSVTSPDTIHAGADVVSLYQFAKENKIAFSEKVSIIFNL